MGFQNEEKAGIVKIVGKNTNPKLKKKPTPKTSHTGEPSEKITRIITKKKTPNQKKLTNPIP